LIRLATCAESMFVIAELDLVHGDGIVFIDNGNNTKVEERFEGMTRVQEARAVLDVVFRKENLADMEALFIERVPVFVH